MNLEELQKSMEDLSISVGRLFSDELEERIKQIGFDYIKEIHYIEHPELIQNAYIVDLLGRRVWNVSLALDHENMEIILRSRPVFPVEK